MSRVENRGVLTDQQQQARNQSGLILLCSIFAHSIFSYYTLEIMADDPRSLLQQVQRQSLTREQIELTINTITRQIKRLQVLVEALAGSVARVTNMRMRSIYTNELQMLFVCRKQVRQQPSSDIR